jgi:hypothetical protein
MVTGVDVTGEGADGEDEGRALGGHDLAVPDDDAVALVVDCAVVDPTAVGLVDHVETATGDYLYPDLVATCDERDQQDPLIKRHPTLIIEVLSPSTEGYDHGEKFDAFASAMSLIEYVLVSTRDQRVEIWTRHEGHWERTTYLPLAQIPISTINLLAFFEDLYLGVHWGPRLLTSEESSEAGL